MTAARRRGVGIILAALVVAGCGSATPTRAPATGPSGSPADAATPTASAPATATATATALASASATVAPTRTPSPTRLPTPRPTPPPPPDWPVYHGDAGRSGVSGSVVSPVVSIARAWSDRLDGAVYAEPLVVGGRLVVATEGDSVYALNPSSGSVIWRRHLGTPVPLSSLPCGDIDPLGITSTPAFDPVTGSIFTVAEISGPAHVLFALDPATGAVRWSRSVDLAGDDPRTHQQRAALAVGYGYVYIGFGGLAGDCGQYVGEVVGIPTSGSGATIAYRVPAAREAAIWSTGGPVLDGAGNVYISVGNGSSTSTYDGSDSVVELTSTLHERSYFAPSTWASDNGADLDLGSLSPTLVPGGYVFIAGKAGTGYVLHQGSLGGIGGQVSQASVCAAFGGTARSGSTVYVPCSDGVRSVSIRSDGTIHVNWRTPTGSNGPPVIAGGAIWTVATGSGVLFALSPGSGSAVAQLSVGAVPHFVSPTPWNGMVFVGTMAGIVAVRVAT